MEDLEVQIRTEEGETILFGTLEEAYKEFVKREKGKCLKRVEKISYGHGFFGERTRWLPKTKRGKWNPLSEVYLCSLSDQYKKQKDNSKRVFFVHQLRYENLYKSSN